MDAPTKIRDLDLVVNSNQNIFRLDVTVHDVLLVEVFQRGCHLSDILGGSPLWKAIRFSKVLVKLPFPSELEDEEDSLAVVEVTIESENVWVPQITVNLNLSPHLFLHFSLLQFALVEDLESADETRGSLLGQINSPKLSLAQGLSDLEHSQVPVLRLVLFRNGRRRVSMICSLVGAPRRVGTV